jgi:release factor glutamine methyltransferase
VNAREAAAAAAARLGEAGVQDAKFEAEVLTRESAGVSRAQFFAGATLEPRAEKRLESFVERRMKREPGAYITGHREFFGRDFAVGPGVLIPRPETELLVELGLAELDDDPSAHVVEVGTGSGAVAISLAVERPEASITATEVSHAAMAFARLNAERLGGSPGFVLGDLAVAIGRADVVLANLPYIPSWEIEALEPEVSKWEPLVALDGGVDGFVLIRRLIEDCASRLHPRLLALEVAFGQAEGVAAILREFDREPWSLKDLTGIDRVVCARWR